MARSPPQLHLTCEATFIIRLQIIQIPVIHSANEATEQPPGSSVAGTLYLHMVSSIYCCCCCWQDNHRHLLESLDCNYLHTLVGTLVQVQITETATPTKIIVIIDQTALRTSWSEVSFDVMWFDIVGQFHIFLFNRKSHNSIVSGFDDSVRLRDQYDDHQVNDRRTRNSFAEKLWQLNKLALFMCELIFT